MSRLQTEMFVPFYLFEVQWMSFHLQQFHSSRHMNLGIIYIYLSLYKFLWRQMWKENSVSNLHILFLKPCVSSLQNTCLGKFYWHALHFRAVVSVDTFCDCNSWILQTYHNSVCIWENICSYINAVSFLEFHKTQIVMVEVGSPSTWSYVSFW